MSTHLEIERKWILTSIPDVRKLKLVNPVSKELIQWYNKEGRWRHEKNFNLNIDEYIHCVKKKISKGIVEETEENITEEVFNEKIKKNKGYIRKNRFEWIVGDCKFFLDFLSSGTIFLEVEIPRLDYPVILPDFILDCSPKEVTGMKGTSNYAMRLPQGTEHLYNNKKYDMENAENNEIKENNATLEKFDVALSWGLKVKTVNGTFTTLYIDQKTLEDIKKIVNIAV